MIKKISSLFLMMLLFIPFFAHKSSAADLLDLYTPYTGISVTPGDSINYNVNVLNHSSSIQDVSFSLKGLPKSWKYTLTSGGYNLHNLSVQGGGSQSISLNVTVPLKINKGTYHFELIAKNSQVNATLPLSVTVSQKGTFKTELNVAQPNMEGHNNSSFDFTATLKNQTANKERYALTSGGPQGWSVTYKVGGKSVTSVQLDPNTSKSIDISVQPPQNVTAGTYKIPIKASSGTSSASTTLEAVITGTYSLNLTTPSGNLSTKVTAGHSKSVTLLVKNTGSATLHGISLSANTPANWNVNFATPKILKLDPGKSQKVKATIKAAKNAITGDYVVDMTAQTPNASSDASIRTTVKTSTLWGWVGVLIILVVIGGIYYLFRTYGRR